jgi:hypothetical protein
LNEETWKSIEISCLRVELETKLKDFPFSAQPAFWYNMGTLFDSIASKESKNISVDELDDFLKQIKRFISPRGIHRNKPIELKILYNMFCVVIRYHQDKAFIKLLQEINHNSLVKSLIKVLLEHVAECLLSLNRGNYYKLLRDHPILIPNYLIGPIRDDEIRFLNQELE